MKLSEFPKKRPYSMSEYHLFATLPQDGSRIGSTDIAKVRGDEWDVKFPLKNITVTMNLLISKVDANNEPFKIGKEGKYSGHPTVEYWLEPRKTVKKKSAASAPEESERPMSVVILAVGFADGSECPHANHWLKHFDHEANGGQGHGVFTLDPDEAMRFRSAAHAMLFWGKQSLVRPRRPDGQPNKPMTALTVVIETLL